MAISIADSSCSSTRSSLGFLLDPEKVDPPRPKQSMWHRLGLRRWLGRDDRDFSSSRSPASTTTTDSSPASNNRSKRTSSPPPKSHDNLTRRLSRRVGVGLPRSTTFKRQHSERRDRLSPVDPEPRRAVSADRRTLSVQRTRSPQPAVDPRLSAPEVHWRDEPDPAQTTVDEPPEPNEEHIQDSGAPPEWNPYPEVTDSPEEYPVDILDMELEKRWILNLSMHFRDRSEREKFFVTYAEAPNRWRRVTISCDYRDAEPDSLEQDLKELRYQRDKCARIYESIRESLPDIQFYDTVTNLKLETRDSRLHVHVTEDVNEIIPYPPISCIGHLPEARLIPERRLHFEAHLSGFVYNVRLDGRSFIKKEIPGPDTVDEFLYEINALHALQSTPNVIQVEGVVVDDRQEIVKGLLISFAEKGALVDILYEYRGTISWERRERWARQIVQGLCEIHEAGYVQGDFTLSNIVVDANDDAKIIDINRRGCPVGWEPPEIATKIESNQRISMYIGVKTDIFQLGMTLWALAMEEDEPERQRRPFVWDDDVPVPDYYRRVVSICLSPIPRHRLSAKELLNFFPREPGFDQLPRMQPTHTSVGVGLHNGALPLYDSRAAFLYPRGRQMGSFGHRNSHIPFQPPNDSFESIPSPETERDREEEQQIVLDDMVEPATPQPNGVRKEDSITFDQRWSVDSLIPVTGESAISLKDTLEPWKSAISDHEEHEIDLDADLLPPNAKALPDELAGVDNHAAHSWTPLARNNPAPDSVRQQDVPGFYTVTRTPSDVYPVDSEAEAWSDHEPSRSVSSLLQSVLPINPAANSPEQEIDTTADISHLSIQSVPEYPQNVHHQSPNLSDSSLPINPAVKSLEEILEPKADPPSSPSLQPTQEDPQDVTQGQCSYLCDSQLPINPAAKISGEPSKLEEDNLPNSRTKSTPEHSEKNTQNQSLYPSDSHLPINPAANLSEETCITEMNTPLPLSDQPTLNSQPSIQDQGSFLTDSQLPINPAISSMEVAVDIEPDTPLSPSQQSTLHFQSSMQNQSSYFSNSQLPINPTAKHSEEADLKPDTPLPLSDQSTLHPQSSIQEQGSSLNDSNLPINPAFTDKALQYV